MEVEFPSGPDTLRGALYLPEMGPPAPGVVVIPDVRGLYEHFHDIARRLAASGYAALAVDLYSRGEVPDISTPQTTFKFIAELPDTRVIADLQAAIDFLAGHAQVTDRIGMTGFCMGGKLTWLAAANCRGLSSAAAWYGMLRSDQIDANNPEHPIDAVERLSCPVLGLFGAEDPFIPLDQVADLESRAAEHGLDVEVVVYPGAGHAFANSSRPEGYREEAAEDAWRRVFSLFERTLGAE